MKMRWTCNNCNKSFSFDNLTLAHGRFCVNRENDTFAGIVVCPCCGSEHYFSHKDATPFFDILKYQGA
jgi:hypothetical protein